MKLSLLYEDKRGKRVFIIHGWGGSPNDKDWIPWLKKQLKKKKIECHVLPMPVGKPDLTQWVQTLKYKVGEPDKNTYFVGHSIGCQAILRYLAREKKKAGGAVLVAAWTKLSPECSKDKEDAEVIKQWSKPIQWKKIDTKCTVILSKDDPDVPFDKNEKIFRKKLGAKIVVEKDKGHFSADDKVRKLPVVMRELEKLGC